MMEPLLGGADRNLNEIAPGDRLRDPLPKPIVLAGRG
jgi:hypothetical protein